MHRQIESKIHHRSGALDRHEIKKVKVYPVKYPKCKLTPILRAVDVVEMARGIW